VHKKLILKQFICKNYSYQCGYDCAQLCYTMLHRTVLIIFPAQTLSNRGRGNTCKYNSTQNYCIEDMHCIP